MKATRVFLLIGLGLLLPGCPSPDTQTSMGSLTPEYFVFPGFPAVLTDSANPCFPDGTWVTGDSFKLTVPPNGISVDPIVTSQQTPTRKLVAQQGVLSMTQQPVSYSYGRPGLADVACVGRILVTTAPLQVSVIASRTSISAGETSQLGAFATGGKPPYSYLWTPFASLSSSVIANPFATPSATTTYTVTVTDDVGQRAPGMVTVTVSGPATFTLTVAVTLSGTLGPVSSNPQGIFSCPFTSCVASFPSFTTVVLTAEASAAPTWGNCTSVDNSSLPFFSRCTVVMNANKTVTVSPSP